MIVEHKKHITVTNKSGVVKRHAQSTIKTISSMQTENFNEVQDSEIAQSYTFNQFTVTNNGYRGTNLAIYKPEKLGEDLPDWFFDGTQNLTMNQNQVQIEDPNFATTFTSNVGAFTSISFQYHDLQFPEIVTFYNAAGEAFQAQNLNVVGTSFESGPGTAQGIFSSGTLSQAAISFVVSGTGDAWNMDNLSFELAYTPPPTPPTPPAPPSPVALVINTSTGIIPSGGLTNNATPVISGTGIASDTVTVTNGGKPVGSTTVAANGTWTLPVSTPLADGMQNISATQTDPVGNTSTPTTTSFTIDTIPDSPPTVTITSDANHDGILNIAELAGSGNKINLQIGLPKDASAGDILTVTDQAGNTVTQALTAANIAAGHVVLNGNFNAPASGTTFTAKATLTDTAGNVSLPGSASDQIQNIAPPAPNVVSGGLTNNATPVISGTGIAGDTITVTNGGKPVGSTTVAANGTWTLPVSTPLADGMQNISATQTDPVGNTSTPTTTSFTIDTIPDSPPTVTITSDANHDGIINIAELAGSANKINLQIGLPKDASAGDILTVTDQAGNTVTQALTAANIGAGHVVLNGNFNAPTSGTTFTAKATLTDTAGNVSLPGSASDQIQNIAPSAPNVVISNPSASIANGGLTDNTSPSISGKGVAGDKVSITDEGKALGTVTVGANGTWTLPLTTPLTNGVQNISAIQIDPYGNSSTPTNTSFTVTTQSVAVTNITGTIVTPATTQTETFDEANYPYSGQIYGFNKFNVTSNGYCGTRLQMIQSGYLLNDSTQCLMINANQYQVASSNFATTFSSKVGSFSSISFQYNDLQIPAVITFYNAAGQAFESENLNAVGTSAFCGQGKGVFSSGALWQSATSFVISGTGDAWTMDNLIFTTPASSAAVSIASGSKTTATDPCLKGTISHALYSGEIVEVYRNGTDIGKATVNGTNWTYNDKIGSGSAAIYTAKVIENGAAVATSNSYSINAMVQAMAAIAPSSAAITSPSITTSSATTPVLAVMH